MRYLTRVNFPCLAFVFAGLALAAEAAPIRVAIFTGESANRYWHITSPTWGVAIQALLERPDTARLGDSLAVHSGGLRVAQFGYVQGCNFGCTVTEGQKTAFLNALDTTDVVLFLSNSGLGDVFSDTTQRRRILDFARTRGMVGFHATVFYVDMWPDLKSMQGASFFNIPNSPRAATIRRDSAARLEPSWRFLNRGLQDTSLVDEWVTFNESGASIRAVPGLKVLLNVDEGTYAGGMGGATPMGDHPISWYRAYPTGGRFFYTSLGERLANLTGGAGPRFLRRQLYNAVLWAGRADSGGPVAVRPVTPRHDGIRITGSRVVVAAGNGPRTVEIRALNGTLLRRRRGTGAIVFELDRGAVYIVSVSGAAGTSLRRVLVP